MTDKFPGITFAPHQTEGADELIKQPVAYLWDEAGTGKTLTAMLAAHRKGINGGVVVGPPSSIDMWSEQLETQLGARVLTVTKSAVGKKAAEAVANREYDYIVTTFGLTTAHKVAELLELHLRATSGALIIDEAHYCKTVGTKRTSAILGVSDAASEYITVRTHRGYKRVKREVEGTALIQHANFTVQLTGTPVMRYYDDLYAPLASGRPDTMKKYGVDTLTKFQDKFCSVGQMPTGGGRYRRVINGNKNLDELLLLLDECGIVRNFLEDVEKNMPAVMHRLISAPVKEPPAKLDYSPNEVKKQINKADSPYATEYRKLAENTAEYAAEHAAEIADNEAVLLGFHHRAAIDKAVAWFATHRPDWVVEIISGSVPLPERERIRLAFNDDQVNVLIGQMTAMRESMNLQECGKYIVIGEQVPSPGVLEQFIARVARRGQKHAVQVDHIYPAHPLAKSVREIRETKEKDNEALIGNKNTP